MNKEEYVRDFDSRKIIGIIRTEPNGDQAAVEFPSRKVLGYYRAKQDHTTDFFGRVLNPGNTVVSLIYRKK